MPTEELPVAEFAFPGPLRDQLVAAILAGTKTTTTGLVASYEREQEPLPHPGLRQAVVVDHHDVLEKRAAETTLDDLLDDLGSEQHHCKS